jgi:hypothetical protein
MTEQELPTFADVKSSGAQPEPGVHLWMRYQKLICCAWCGSTNRKLERPCKGVVRVELRGVA